MANFFDDYEEYLNGLRNRIFEIFNKFRDCQDRINAEYKKGFIAPAVAQKMLSVKITDYVPSTDLQYRLTKEEVDFIRTYAELDENGELLSTFLKPQYLEKSKLLGRIRNSVEVLNYFNKFDLETRKVKLKECVEEIYYKEIKSIKEKIANIKLTRPRDYEYSPQFKELAKRLESYNRTLDSLDRILNMDEEDLNHTIISFFKVNPEYYEWYVKMLLRDAYETGSVYKQHEITMTTVITQHEGIVDREEKIKKLNNKMSSLKDNLIAFLEYLLDLDYDSFEEENKGKFKLFGKNRNNKDLLFKMFSILVPYVATSGYFDKYREKEQEEDTINFEKCFEKYFAQTYGEDISYVELENFVEKFREELVKYYKKLIKECAVLINEENKKLNSANLVHEDDLGRALEQANLQRAIREEYNEGASKCIGGFNAEDSKQIFLSLKEILSNGVRFGTGSEAIIRKV